MKFAPALRAAVTPFRSERALHLWMLCAFAFSEPLFAALNRQFVYLHDLDAGWLEISYLVFVLTVIIPVFWILLDQAAHWISRFRGERGRDVVLGTLFFIVWLTLLRPFMRLHYLELHSTIWLASIGGALAATVVSLLLYQRMRWVRLWMSLAAIGIVCFPGAFLIQFSSLKQTKSASVTARKPAPVFMIVFDEFCGLSLMNPSLQIDATRFPNFQRLARTSTWYRQASTVHVRTDVAVPAMLTGRYPVRSQAPLESEHPGNLFQLIEGTGAYDMTVYEPITRLCPDSVRRRILVRRTSLEKIRLLTGTLLGVYPRLILPNDTPINFPAISRVWFGLPETAEAERLRYPLEISGLRRFQPFAQRSDQLAKFLTSMQTVERPLFGFLHVELPHIPCCYFPSGRQYNYDDLDSFRPAGARGEIGEDWGTAAAPVVRNEHRYLLQLQFVDRFIGQFLDRLQETGLLETSLVVVTADHGVSYRPGHSRRVPDTETLPDLLSVPLFIKLPRQTNGLISDLNVESVDILPTIAEELGIELEEPVDGVSVSQANRRARKTLYLDQGMTILEPSIPHLEKAIQRRWNIFGTDSLDHPPQQACTHPDWHGRSIGQFAITDGELNGLRIFSATSLEFGMETDSAPALVRGTLDTRQLSRNSVDLVLVANGVVVDTGTTFAQVRTSHGFEFLLPETVAVQRDCQMELLHVVGDGPIPRLQRLKKWSLGQTE